MRGVFGAGSRWQGSLAVLLVAAGCGTSGKRANRPVSESSPDAGEASASVPDFSSDAPAEGAAFARRPGWQRAESGDPLDLARLAQAEGASGLLRGVEQGGRIGRTALGALPYADDAELALGRLCEILESGAQTPVLEAVHAIVARPPESVERLDASGWRRCAAALAGLEGAESAHDRDLATSARALIVEHGVRPER